MRFLFFFLLIFAAAFAPAQSCYTRLEDASGFNTDAYQADLEAAACALRAAFPDTFQNKFKVYDFGFYLHQETYSGGYPEAFAQKIAQVNANPAVPYYLLFGKQTDASGVYTRFWVEVKLPTGNYFQCLDSLGFNTIKTGLGLYTNYQYDSLGGVPSRFAYAEEQSMAKMRRELLKMKECCFFNKGMNCNPTCLSAQELRLFAEELGFDFAIPISILGDSPLLRPLGASRVTDCAKKAIKIDNTVYPDFGSTVGNILSCYGDTSVRAVIVDNDCACPPKGSIQYIRGLSGQKEVVLTFYIWKNPAIPLEDIMYVRTKLPEKLGKLPFKGHFPINVNNMEVPIDAGAIKSTVESVFSKNGFSLTSIDTNNPQTLTTLDLFNEVRYCSDCPSAGYSQNAYPPDKFNYINYKLVALSNRAEINSITHTNYLFGVHIAHEFVHQIMTATHKYIYNIYPVPLDAGGHCTTAPNLLFPGNGMNIFASFLSPLQIEAIIQSGRKEHSWYLLYASGLFYPKGNYNSTSPWEKIPPSYKFFISLGLLLRELENKFGKKSPEFLCAAKIISTRIQTLDVNNYEVK